MCFLSRNNYSLSIVLMSQIMVGFPQKYNSLLHLLLFTLMRTVSLGVLSVAPDDFAIECTAHAKNGSFNNSNQKVLLDTQFYPSTTLLSVVGDDELWISVDFDMTTGTGVGKVRIARTKISKKRKASV